MERRGFLASLVGAGLIAPLLPATTEAETTTGLGSVPLELELAEKIRHTVQRRLEKNMGGHIPVTLHKDAMFLETTVRRGDPASRVVGWLNVETDDMTYHYGFHFDIADLVADGNVAYTRATQICNEATRSLTVALWGVRGVYKMKPAGCLPESGRVSKSDNRIA
jgi:hypothetical protein